MAAGVCLLRVCQRERMLVIRGAEASVYVLREVDEAPHADDLGSPLLASIRQWVERGSKMPHALTDAGREASDSASSLSKVAITTDSAASVLRARCFRFSRLSERRAATPFHLRAHGANFPRPLS